MHKKHSKKKMKHLRQGVELVKSKNYYLQFKSERKVLYEHQKLIKSYKKVKRKEKVSFWKRFFLIIKLFLKL